MSGSREFRPRVGIVGATRFGIALAEVAARNGFGVTLFTSIPQRATALKKNRRYPSRVPELERLHRRVKITGDPVELADNCHLVLLAMGREFVSRIMERIGSAFDGAHYLIHSVHMLEGRDLARASQLIREYTCVKQVGVLAGPIHVSEIFAGKPNAAVVGSPFPDVITAARDAFSNDVFRVYGDSDMRGVELAAALGQVIAIGVGMADGAGMGAAAHATLITRGLREIATVGTLKRADERTFFGLAGIGRLVDALRRGEPNYKLGHDIGAGGDPDSVISAAPGEALGVRVIWQLQEFAEHYGVELPMCSVLAQILDGDGEVTERLGALLRDVPDRSVEVTE